MFRALVGVLLGLVLVTAYSQEKQIPSFSVSVDLIKVPISVFDDRGVMVRDLDRSDFVIYEDGVRQEIRSFGIDRNPVSAVLVLDTSATVEKELKQLKDAATTFAEALSPGDRISVVIFSDEAELLLDWTTDMGRVRKTLKKVEKGWRTALYDAMYIAGNDQLKNIDGRKAIVLLTDMLNNQSSASFDDASRAIVQSQASLYVVSKTVMVREAARHQRRVVMLDGIYRRLFGESDYIDKFFNQREAEMTELAEKTGGRCFFPTAYDQIRTMYAEVARELGSKYYLTYVSNQQKEPNTYHRITLEYLPPHSKLIYRKGYYHQPRHNFLRVSPLRPTVFR
jgi:Ca-activated chloride channel homolog